MEDLAESIKNKTELLFLFASFLFVFRMEKDEIFRKVVRFRMCLYMERQYCERNLIMFFFDFGLILNLFFIEKSMKIIEKAHLGRPWGVLGRVLEGLEAILSPRAEKSSIFDPVLGLQKK